MSSKATTSPNEMSFLDHLEELRWHLIRSVLAVVIIGSVAFLMKDFIFDTVIFGPKKMDYFVISQHILDSTRLFVPTNYHLPYKVD